MFNDGKRGRPSGLPSEGSSGRGLKAMHADTPYIQQRTQETLMQASRAMNAMDTLEDPPIGTTSFTHSDAACWVCRQSNETTSCSYCHRLVCRVCVRQCESCLDVFCTFCSTVNYDCRHERTFCYTCNTEEQRGGSAAGMTTTVSAYAWQAPSFM